MGAQGPRGHTHTQGTSAQTDQHVAQRPSHVQHRSCGIHVVQLLVVIDTIGSHNNNECEREDEDRKSTRLNSSHLVISYAVFCLKKKKSLASIALKYDLC